MTGAARPASGAAWTPPDDPAAPPPLPCGALDLDLRLPAPPRPYQQEALRRWLAAGRRGVVVLPTGTGKSILAMMAMRACRVPALVLVPTIDLLRQWAGGLELAFGAEVGRLGGGEHRVLPLTVATYDSGLIHRRDLAPRFGLLVADECHHLPAGGLRGAAESLEAPFRLGLTATPERPDGLDALLDGLIGPVVHAGRIEDMRGEWLAPYATVRVPVPLSDREAEEYREHRARYLAFLGAQRIRAGSPEGWRTFLAACVRSQEGRRAFLSWRRQREIAQSSRSKMAAVWEILRRHRRERALVFTADNATAYRIGETFRLPVLTHHTEAAERASMLAGFRAGEPPVLVTSRVLNEGVDVPEASVGVVVSGSGSVREHVQRLGRILRPSPGKEAVLYELVSEDTAEETTSERRRRHGAYQAADKDA